jgi:hypothetical protein
LKATIKYKKIKEMGKNGENNLKKNVFLTEKII